MMRPNAACGTSKTSTTGSQSIARFCRTQRANNTCSLDPCNWKHTSWPSDSPPSEEILTRAPDFWVTWNKTGQREFGLCLLEYLKTRNCSNHFFFFFTQSCIDNTGVSLQVERYFLEENDLLCPKTWFGILICSYKPLKEASSSTSRYWILDLLVTA